MALGTGRVYPTLHIWELCAQKSLFGLEYAENGDPKRATYGSLHVCLLAEQSDCLLRRIHRGNCNSPQDKTQTEKHPLKSTNICVDIIDVGNLLSIYSYYL